MTSRRDVNVTASPPVVGYADRWAASVSSLRKDPPSAPAAHPDQPNPLTGKGNRS